MSKTKSSEISHYELLYIISNKYSEDELKPINQNVVKIINDNGGEITHTEDWGGKRLAYPIKHYNHGYFFLIEFNLGGEKAEKINNNLNLSSDVLRHQIVTKKIKTEEEIKKENEISKKITAKTGAKEKMEEEKTKGKVNLKDLDEKLDKILETDDLL